MAEKKPKMVVRRKVETVRERADKQQAKKEKQPRTRKVTAAANRPVKGVRSILKREYHPIKLPDNKAGRVLTKRRNFIPRYFVEAGQEVKLVTWPTKRQAASMSLSVIGFSVVIAILVKLLDFGFEKIFRGVILK
jgi:preprotein translocase SecE subunit